MKIAGQASWRIIVRGRTIFWNKWLNKPVTALETAPEPGPEGTRSGDDGTRPSGAVGVSS